MKLLLDANLSWRLVKLLEGTYPDVKHIDFVNLKKPAKDIEIWNFAKSENRIIITNDDDFYHLAMIKGFPPKVVILRFGNQTPQQISKVLIHHKQDILSLNETPDTGILEIV